MRQQMQIIVPMSGFGKRFQRAGYNVPKPLIEIDGKPIIAYVVEMFPGEADFIFVCNQDHLDHPAYRMAEILAEVCPTGRVVGIPSHQLGPIYAVLQAADLIDPTRPVIINYCDFTCYWDWKHFKAFVQDTKCVGAIPAYRGFHPHTLGNTNYAYIREQGGWIRDIQEKQPYTDDRMSEFASSGTYYFSSGATMSEALRLTMEQNLNVAGEFYVSLAYKPLLASAQPIAVYPLQHFMQWGTPEDVQEYLAWSATFKALVATPQKKRALVGTVVIPMAGLGLRFGREGYQLTKPLIPVSGQSMIAQATRYLPNASHHVFVLRSDMPGHAGVVDKLKQQYPAAFIETLPEVTDGQARTALLGLRALQRQIGRPPGPIIFGACDNGALYDNQILQGLMDDPSVDVIVWGVRGHVNAIRNPEMFGWIDAENGVIREISVKRPLSAPASDLVVVGTFIFRRAEDFEYAAERMIGREEKVNGEFYIDSCINDAIDLGMKCRVFEVDQFVSWGTPDDLRTFEYWQSCFHKWSGHEYRLELDHRVPSDATGILSEQYSNAVPETPRSHP